MRVGELSLKVEAEVHVVLDFLGTKLDGICVLAFFRDGSGEEWVEDCVDFLADTLDHHDVAVGDRLLDALDPLALRELDNM